MFSSREHSDVARLGHTPFINRAPVEILGRIFEALCARNRFSNEGIVIPASWLGVVCRMWRIVTLATPSLWSNLYLCGRPHDRHLWLLDLVLERSGSSGLYILHDAPIRAPSISFFANLLRHCDRWVHMDLKLPFDLLPTLGLVRNRLTRLESLHLVIKKKAADLDRDATSNTNSDSRDKQSGIYIDPTLFQTFSNAPSIRTIHLGRCTSQFSFPWNQITNYTSTHENLRHSLQNARQCVDLRKLTIACIPWPAFDRTVSSVEFPHLRNLRIRNQDGNDAYVLTVVIPHITVPSLTLLEISHVADEYIHWPHDIMLSFLARSSYPCPLQKLVLNRVEISPDNLIELLRELPLLRILIVEEVPWRTIRPLTDQVIAAMICRDPISQPSSPSSGGNPAALSPSKHSVPLLNHIDLKGDLLFSHHLFVDMIESRLPLAPNNWTTPVMSVKLDWPYRMMDEGAEERMENLEERGLRYWICENSCNAWSKWPTWCVEPVNDYGNE